MKRKTAEKENTEQQQQQQQQEVPATGLHESGAALLVFLNDMCEKNGGTGDACIMLMASAPVKTQSGDWWGCATISQDRIAVPVLDLPGGKTAQFDDKEYVAKYFKGSSGGDPAAVTKDEYPQLETARQAVCRELSEETHVVFTMDQGEGVYFACQGGFTSCGGARSHTGLVMCLDGDPVDLTSFRNGFQSRNACAFRKYRDWCRKNPEADESERWKRRPKVCDMLFVTWDSFEVAVRETKAQLDRYKIAKDREAQSVVCVMQDYLGRAVFGVLRNWPVYLLYDHLESIGARIKAAVAMIQNRCGDFVSKEGVVESGHVLPVDAELASLEARQTAHPLSDEHKLAWNTTYQWGQGDHRHMDQRFPKKTVPWVLVIGSTEPWINIWTKTLCHAFGMALAKCDCALLTGGTSGVPRRVEEAFVEARRGMQKDAVVVRVLPHNHVESTDLNVDYGTTIRRGDDLAVRRREITRAGLADVVLCLAGGPGAVEEATLAFESKIPVILVPTTGGATDGAVDFPARDEILKATWCKFWTSSEFKKFLVAHEQGTMDAPAFICATMDMVAACLDPIGRLASPKSKSKTNEKTKHVIQDVVSIDYIEKAEVAVMIQNRCDDFVSKEGAVESRHFGFSNPVIGKPISAKSISKAGADESANVQDENTVDIFY